MESLRNLTGMYEGEPALGASPAPHGEVLALEDNARFRREIAEDARWIWGSSLNHAPLFRTHRHASTRFLVAYSLKGFCFRSPYSYEYMAGRSLRAAPDSYDQAEGDKGYAAEEEHPLDTSCYCSSKEAGHLIPKERVGQRQPYCKHHEPRH